MGWGRDLRRDEEIRHRHLATIPTVGRAHRLGSGSKDGDGDEERVPFAHVPRWDVQGAGVVPWTGRTRRKHQHLRPERAETDGLSERDGEDPAAADARSGHHHDSEDGQWRREVLPSLSCAAQRQPRTLQRRTPLPSRSGHR